MYEILLVSEKLQARMPSDALSLFCKCNAGRIVLE
jgi:hypothetical protein